MARQPEPEEVVNLGEPSSLDPALAGGKASRLGLLAREGFPVPPGVIVTAPAFARYLRLNRIHAGGSSAEVAAAVRAGRLTISLEASLEGLATRLGHGPLAVRSSAIAEDGSGRSMAGMLETYLGTSATAVAQRLRDCWASLYAKRVSAYLGPGASSGGMAVLVQRQIPARWSGVLFTVDPATGDGDVMVVEWVEGLGEALVGGQVTPDRLVLPRRAPEVARALPGALRAALEALHAVALRAEQLFGAPLDLEWCVDADGLHLLQARPITAVSGGGRCAWSSVNVGENYPGAVSPLTWSVVDRFRAGYLDALAARLWVPRHHRSALRPFLDNLLGVHRGRVHYNLTSWYRLFALVPGGPALRRSFDRYVGQAVPFGRGPAEAGAAVRLPALRMAIALLLRWIAPRRLIAAFRRRVHARRIAWRRLLERPDTPLAAGRVLGDTVRFLERGWGDAALADLSAMVFPALLAAVATAWLPPPAAAEAPGLLRGLRARSTEALGLLHALARSVARDPELAERLAAERYDDLAAHLDSEGRRLWQAFLSDFGGRSYQDLLLTSPTFEERPDLAWRLVRGYVAAGAPDPAAREDAEVEARERLLARLLGQLPRWKRPVLAWLASRARLALSHREEVRLCQGLVYGEVRRAALALGAALVAAGRLESVDDVFQLGEAELERLVSGRFLYPETIPALVRLRRAAAARASTAGRRLPAFFVLPEGAEWREPGGVAAGGAFAGIRGARGSSERSWRGLGVSPGIAEGVVRVVLDPAEEGTRLRRGEILVAPATDPGWTPLFPMASAVVLERGGMLSHAAIVAREVGIPVVVGIAEATSILRNGARVRVDGRTGEVSVLAAGPGR